MVVNKNKYSILIVILSVLLAVSTIAGITFAWFYSDDYANLQLRLGQAVRIRIIDEDGFETNELPINISGRGLVPGMPIAVLAAAKLDTSNTPALVRARLTVDVEGASGDLTESDINFLRGEIHTALQNNVSTNGQWMFSENNVQEIIEGDLQTISDGGWWYYLGDNPVNAVDPLLTELKRVESGVGVSDEDRTVLFIDDNTSFNFPSSIDNKFARTVIKIRVEFQALQGLITPPQGMPGWELDTGSDYPTYAKNRLVNLFQIFHDSFLEGKFYITD